MTSVQLAADLRQLDDNGVTVHDATEIVLWPVRLQHVCESSGATRGRPKPSAALKRITNEIHDLHAEVFQRLSDHPANPRRGELAQRARQLTA